MFEKAKNKQTYEQRHYMYRWTRKPVVLNLFRLWHLYYLIIRPKDQTGENIILFTCFLGYVKARRHTKKIPRHM